MMKTLSGLCMLLAISLSVGCEEKEATAAEDKASEAAAAPAPPEKTAEEKAAEEKAAAEAKKQAEEEAKIQAELAANPITECCRALGQKGFTERSPQYMAASKVCGAALEDEKKLESVIGQIEKELEGKATPDECKAK